MCGINGILNFGGRQLGDELRLVSDMNDRIAHRGPDDSGVWRSPDRMTTLGHRRLSIIDLTSAGHQPMSTSHGPVVVFNGEIYNYQELKTRFTDYKFQSDSDTEVLLAAYERFGDGFLDQLNGMFALAIWDPELRTLFLARDRVGKKPLYYTTQGGIFAFSSEIKALLTLPWVSAALDEKALYSFLTFNFVPAPATMFQGIQKLPPGCKMRVSTSGDIRIDEFWEVEIESELGTQDDIENRLTDEIDRAVGYRMVSDVPVGAFLSGGVDSTATVAFMQRHVSYKIKTFSIGFEGEAAYDETLNARQAAKLLDTDHYEAQVTKQNLVDFLPRIVDIFDEPLADPTCIPIYFLSAMARDNGIKVVVNGDGPDELLLGYRSWARYARLFPYYRAFCRTPRFFRNGIANAALRANDLSSVTELLYRAAKDQELFWGGASSFKESTKRKFLTEGFLERVGDVNCHQEFVALRQRFDAVFPRRLKSDVNWMCYVGLRFLIPNFYTYRADRLTMAHSIEARSPFLDFNFVNYAFSLDARWKYQQGIPKFILKKSLEKSLPREVLHRKKQGFCVPLKEWASDILVDEIEANLDSFCNETGIFLAEAVRAHLNELRQGKTDFVNRLWTIYFLLMWYRRWMA